MKICHLMEMPQVTTTNLDWGLSTDVVNRRRANMLLHDNPSPIRIFSAGKLYKTLQEVFFVSNDTGLIDYYMKYKNGQIPGLGQCATQVKVWRRAGIGVRNLTSIVFYEIMLREFDTMVSDRVQTEDGQRFWIDRLSESRADGRQIGIIDHANIVPYDRSMIFADWLKFVNGWGRDNLYQEKLFFISNLQLSDNGLKTS